MEAIAVPSDVKRTYYLGMVGAAFYFFPHVTSFTSGLLATGKCLVWPAMLVYQALSLLKF